MKLSWEEMQTPWYLFNNRVLEELREAINEFKEREKKAELHMPVKKKRR
ncbi:MAG: hypothetical protein GF387_01990 [Candidatus Portnoybacteria bacterium]|nr:hypothetical protein [Candidatus Portnoybacteria bacterium]